jgi:hypothetical protein
MAQHTAVINCSADTYLYATGQVPSSYTSNYGQSNPLLLAYINGLMFARDVFAFDLSSIPDDKVITGVTFSFKLNSFQAVDSSGTQYENDTSYPFVIRARCLTTLNKAEIETTLTHKQVADSSSADNIININALGQDSSLNITAMAGAVVTMPINSPKLVDKNLIIGLRCDTSYYLNSMKMQLCYANISSREGSYIPSVTVTYEDPMAVAPTGLVPSNTVRNKAGQIKLNWQNTSIQKNFEVQFSTNGFATYTTATGGTENGYTIPAFAFDNGQTVAWKVRIKDMLDSWSPFSESASFNIGATVPLTPTPISPVDTTVNSSDDIYFRWKFVDDYGYSQARYTIELRKGTDTPITIAQSTTSTISIVQKGIISGGNYSWRVKTQNPFYEESPWTAWQNFYSIGKPELPVITGVSNSMHPLVTWQSTGQNLFELKIYKYGILMHDSGEQIAENNSYTIPDFIDIGDYTLALKINNIYGLWSDETAYNFTISFTRPQKPKISGGSTEDYFIALLVESITPSNLIYHKGPKDTIFSLIATIGTNTYNDILAGCGDNQYFARAINGTGYNDSDIIAVKLDFAGIVLNNGSDYINLWKTLNSDKRKNITIGKDQYQIQLNGRVYPISQSTEFLTHTETHEYAITLSELDHTVAMLEMSELYYRNDKGYRFPAQITGIQLNETELDIYTVSFSLSRLEE